MMYQRFWGCLIIGIISFGCKAKPTLKAFTANDDIPSIIADIDAIMLRLESRYKQGEMYPSFAMSHLAEARQYLQEMK